MSNNSPAAIFSVAQIQTDMSQMSIDGMIEKYAHYDQIISDYESKLNSLTEANIKLTQLIDELNSKLDSNSKEILEVKQQQQVENVVNLQSSNLDYFEKDSEIKDLKEKLESSQQLNLKLKAKVKQLLSKTKAETSSQSASHDESNNLEAHLLQKLREENLKLSKELVNLKREHEINLDNLKNEYLELNLKLSSDSEQKIKALRNELEYIKLEKADFEADLTFMQEENDKLTKSNNLLKEYEVKLQEFDVVQTELLQLRTYAGENSQMQETLIDQLNQEKKNLTSLHAENDRLVNLIKESEDKSRELETVKAELDELRTRLTKTYQTQSNDLDQLKQEKTDLEADLTYLQEENYKLSTSLNTLHQNQLKQQEDYEASIAFMRGLNEQLVSEKNGLETRLAELQDQLLSESALIQELEHLKDTKIILESNFEMLQSQMDQLRSEKLEFDSKLVKLTQEKAALEYEVNNLKGENGNLTECVKGLDEIEALKTEWKELKAANHPNTSSDQNVETLVQEKADLEADLTYLQEENDKLTQALNTSHSNQKSLQTELENVRIQQLKDFEELENLRKNKEISESKLDSLEEEILTLNNEIEQLRQSKHQIDYQLNYLQNENSKLSTERDHDRQLIKSLEDEKSSLKSAALTHNQTDKLEPSQDCLLLQALQESNRFLNDELNKFKSEEYEKLVQQCAELNSYVTDASQKLETYQQELNTKQTMIKNLIKESDDLKLLLQQQKLDYESQLYELNLELSSMKQKRDQLNSVLYNQSNASIVQPSQFNEEDPSSEEIASLNLGAQNHTILSSTSATNFATASFSRGRTPNPQLELQLNVAREKCESVVAKLNILRQQNETLNSKIRTIRSLMN